MDDENDDLVIRVSSLSNAPDCFRRTAAKLFRKMVMGIGYDLNRLTQGIGAAVGIAAHQGCFYAMNHKKTHGELPPLNDIVDSSQSQLIEEMNDREIQYDSGTKSFNDASHQVSSLTRVFVSEIAPNLNPESLEQEIFIIHRGVKILGHYDIKTTEKTILDYKFGADRATDIDCQAQLGGYEIIENMNGFPVSGLECIHISRDKFRIHRQNYDLSLCADLSKRIANMMIDQLKSFETSQDHRAFMCNTSSQMCSQNFCPAYKTGFCPESKVK